MYLDFLVFRFVFSFRFEDRILGLGFFLLGLELVDGFLFWIRWLFFLDSWWWWWGSGLWRKWWIGLLQIGCWDWSIDSNRDWLLGLNRDWFGVDDNGDEFVEFCFCLFQFFVIFSIIHVWWRFNLIYVFFYAL